MWFISHHITPLVINSLRGGHTYMHKHKRTHTYRHLHRNNFKKPGAHRPVAGTRLVQIGQKYRYCSIASLYYKGANTDYNQA